jgi:hypothetical protein
MATVRKPRQPLSRDDEYFFPRTSADQVYVDTEENKMLDEKLKEMDNATADAQAAANLALAGVGTGWVNISEEYKVTCSNSNITSIALVVNKKRNTYHMKLSFSSKAKISVGAKITFTITGGQMPLWNYHDACYSDETIGIGILSPEGTLTTRILVTDWPSGYSLNYTYEYTV